MMMCMNVIIASGLLLWGSSCRSQEGQQDSAAASADCAQQLVPDFEGIFS